MKLHIISVNDRNEYTITNSDADEQDVKQYVREKENKNKYQEVDYNIETIESSDLINLFAQLTEDDLGFRNVCAKLFDVIVNKNTSKLDDLVKK